MATREDLVAALSMGPAPFGKLALLEQDQQRRRLLNELLGASGQPQRLQQGGFWEDQPRTSAELATGIAGAGSEVAPPEYYQQRQQQAWEAADLKARQETWEANPPTQQELFTGGQGVSPEQAAAWDKSLAKSMVWDRATQLATMPMQIGQAAVNEAQNVYGYATGEKTGAEALAASPTVDLAKRAALGNPLVQFMEPGDPVEKAADLAMMGGLIGRAIPGPDNTLGAFAGRMSHTADLPARDRAELMEKAGGTPEEILQATRWYKEGKDWKYEISDRGASLTPAFLAGGMDYATLGRNPTLGEVLDHPELFAAYPDLANLPIEASINSAVSGQGRGRYEPRQGQLRENLFATASDADKLLSVILHEAAGHAVQDREKFHRGGNADEMTDISQAARTRWSKTLYPAAIATIKQEEDAFDAWRSQQGPLSERTARDLYAQQFPERVAALEQAREMRSAFPSLQAHPLYQRVAGEVEARNVQARQYMTDEQRLATPPWRTTEYTPEQQIFMERSLARTMMPGQQYPPLPAQPRYVPPQGLKPGTGGTTLAAGGRGGRTVAAPLLAAGGEPRYTFAGAPSSVLSAAERNPRLIQRLEQQRQRHNYPVSPILGGDAEDHPAMISPSKPSTQGRLSDPDLELRSYHHRKHEA